MGHVACALMCMIVLGIGPHSCVGSQGGQGPGSWLMPTGGPDYVSHTRAARALKSRDDLYVITVAEDETRRLNFWHAVTPIAIFEYRCCGSCD